MPGEEVRRIPTLQDPLVNQLPRERRDECRCVSVQTCIVFKVMSDLQGHVWSSKSCSLPSRVVLQVVSKSCGLASRVQVV
jgi:hypothetical protein